MPKINIKLRRHAADQRYDNYVKTGPGGCGQVAKANCQGWHAYQGPDADPQQAEKLSVNPLTKEANVIVRGYYCLFLSDLQCDKNDNFPVRSPFSSAGRVQDIDSARVHDPFTKELQHLRVQNTFSMNYSFRPELTRLGIYTF